MGAVKQGMTDATLQVGTTSDGDLTLTMEVGNRTMILAMTPDEARAVALRMNQVADLLEEPI